MRTAFIHQLIEEARTRPEIFLVVGDLGFSVVEPFATEFPDRFLNTGIAEQNMTGIAAGLAREGYHVFTYSIANFPTLRCMEQIRYDICYHNLNVTIVSVGAGYSYASLGPSHHATEELGMMRTIPNMTVYSPGDPLEVTALTKRITKLKGPSYLRIGKAGEPNVHDNNADLTNGGIFNVIKGKDTAVIATGGILQYAAQFIRSENKSWSLYSCPVIKPYDASALSVIADNFSRIITIEEHQRSAGAGSAMLECLHDLKENNLIRNIPEVKRIAIPDKFYSVSGSQQYLRNTAGLILNES